MDRVWDRRHGAAEPGARAGVLPMALCFLQRWPLETGPSLPRLSLEEARWRAAWRNPDLEPPKLS